MFISFRTGQLPAAGKVNDRALLLGGILRAGSTFQSGLPWRIAAVDSGCAAMGRYWCQPKLPPIERKAAFLSR
eukprot:5954550-Pyramimonas_sp.AAC.1